jgi:hypothetical protein
LINFRYCLPFRDCITDWMGENKLMKIKFEKSDP